MNDKRDIVPLTDKTKFPKRNSRNTLLLNLKNKDFADCKIKLNT